MTHPQLLTAREVAEWLAVSTPTVLRWARQGDVPVVRLPSGALRFDPDALLGRWQYGEDDTYKSAPATRQRPGAWPQGE